MRKYAVIIAVCLLGYAVLAWFAGSLAGFAGARLWIVRGGLWLLGALAASAIAWLLWKAEKDKAPRKPAAQASGGQIEFLLREAERKLAAAHQPAVGRLPAVLVLGGSGCAKTSAIVHSGLNPELLAGEVYKDGVVAPTAAANLWFANGTIFAEFGGALQQDERGWSELVARLRPAQLRAVLGGGAQAPRAALVCFDAEILAGPGGAEAAAIGARNLRRRLGEISASLGVRLPVYIIFSRFDRVPCFAEYVANLSEAEARASLGAVLPLDAGDGNGVYAEEAGARSGAAFDRIFRTLDDRRIEFLSREHDPARLAPIYEFPREFRKLRRGIVDFLVELSRPGQLAAGPFLRGFYFSGVRPVTVEEAAPRPQQPRPAAAEATAVFRAGAQSAAAPAPQPLASSRRVPQWLFLPEFFQGVLLKDQAAMGASRASEGTSRLRRALLASAALLCAALTTCFAVSFAGNRALASHIAQAAAGAAGPDGAGLEASLQRLDVLRGDLDVLSGYRRDGAPWSLRWGLYTGDRLYPAARRVYFSRFHQVLFGETQSALAGDLRSLPAKPGPAYGPTYDTLKAYLITTLNHDKSTAAFLAPILMRRWSAGRDLNPETQQLARRQFDFYAGELRLANPFGEEADQEAVRNARAYLNQFAGLERVYQAVLADAAKTGPAVSFNRQFPGAAGLVSDPHEVGGAFTKQGWDFVTKTVRDPERYFSGEQWVLGSASSATADREKLPEQLRARYYADFVAEWRAYLKSAAVAKYANLQDAARKLNSLSGNQSPLLALFWLASRNTAVDDPEVANAFQPVHAVVPPASADRYVAPSNQNYMNALVTLQAGLESIASQPAPDDASAAQSASNATAAKVTTRQLAEAFRIDPDAHIEAVVEKLLEDPITNAEGLLRTLGPAELNAKGKALCGQVRALWSKFPFNPNSPLAATPAEVNAVLRKPDGALWAAYDASLQKALVRQGAVYVPNPAGSVRVNPAFADFFTRAAAISEALYAGGAQDPHFDFSLKPVPAEGIQSLGLDIDGQQLTYSGGAPEAKSFTWQASGADKARATVRFGSGPDLAWANADGPWSVFRFFGQAERWQPDGNSMLVEWTIRIGKDAVTLPGGKPLTVRYELDAHGAPPLLQRGYLAKAACVAEIAR